MHWCPEVFILVVDVDSSVDEDLCNEGVVIPSALKEGKRTKFQAPAIQVLPSLLGHKTSVTLLKAERRLQTGSEHILGPQLAWKAKGICQTRETESMDRAEEKETLDHMKKVLQTSHWSSH